MILISMVFMVLHCIITDLGTFNIRFWIYTIVIHKIFHKLYYEDEIFFLFELSSMNAHNVAAVIGIK